MKNHIEFVLSVNCRFGKLIGERYNSDIYEKIKKQMKIEQPEEFELLEQLEFKYVTGPKSSSEEEDSNLEDEIECMIETGELLPLKTRGSERTTESEGNQKETNIAKNVLESINEKEPIKINPKKGDPVPMEIDTSYPQEVREKPPPTLYPKIITQSDGPSDCLSSSSEDEKEDIKHLSMTKKDEQYKRNVKRRKTSKTKEEMEVDQDDRKANLERMEKGKSNTKSMKGGGKAANDSQRNKKESGYSEEHISVCDP
ncbi:hypothetical protein JTB14_018123 [Gonioctena quinquepunctata]|nr:hypothetical protein JTB14_018123 [Gonioctena quinquepunctata]